MSEKLYWEKRGSVKPNDLHKHRAVYPVISAAPYYNKRKKIFFRYVLKLLKKVKPQVICDLGCGDGSNLVKLAKRYSNMKCIGIDISSEMINLAKFNSNRNNNVEFIVSSSGIPQDKKIDCVISSMVFAHISDQEVECLLNNIHTQLNSTEKERIVLYEQVGKYRVEGEHYIRRQFKEYEKLLSDCGFKIEAMRLIDFWVHRLLFERNIAKWFYKNMDGNTDYEKRIEANKNIWYLTLSWLCIFLSKPYIFNNPDKWGYVLIIAKKRDG